MNIDKETLKHYKDCLKVLVQPCMRDLVANYDEVVQRYRDLIELHEKQ